MRLEIANLSSGALSWAVAKCKLDSRFFSEGDIARWALVNNVSEFNTVTEAIFTDSKISLLPHGLLGWQASLPDLRNGGFGGFFHTCYGEHPMVAAMRCYVKSNHPNDTHIEVPETFCD